MKPNQPSRTALIIARQRAAHQLLDHASILYDPFAMKILREDEKVVLLSTAGPEDKLCCVNPVFNTFPASKG